MSDQSNGIINYEAIHERTKNPSGSIEVMLRNRAHSISEASYITVTNISVRQAKYNQHMAEQRNKAEEWRQKVDRDALEASQTPVHAIPAGIEAPLLQSPDMHLLNPDEALQRVNELHSQPKPDTHNFSLPL